jgi:two-component system, chemotaxis family, protein-glutamate methylesterase/glutaminase
MKPFQKALPPGSRIRVLVVDDSVVIRRLVSHALAEDPMIEVAGSAANGVIALQRIPQVNPDVVTLDVEMPEMDGLETLRQIRKLYPQIYVIMFSTLTERGAASTMDALALGANDYVAKAANIGSLDRSMASLRSDLVPKIKQFFVSAESAPPAWVQQARDPAAKNSLTPALKKPKRTRSVVCIGVSTGGPNALAAILPMFPKGFGLPVLIVQHMPPLFTRLLAERLNGISELRVEEAAKGSLVEPGKVLIAPGDYHLRICRSGDKVIATLDQEPPENSCRPAVDVLFRSVAEVYGGAAVAAVLTGMGQDGLRGVENLQALGAWVIAQDEESSVVWGMPGAVARAGLADAVVDLSSVVPEILKQT